MNDLPKILIIGAVPFDPSSQSRSYESFLGKWENTDDRIRQIYSRPVHPGSGLCKFYFQITDKMLINRFFKKTTNVGREIVIENKENNINCDKGIEREKKSFLYSFFRQRKSSLVKLLRKLLWSKKRWASKELLDWTDSFNPDLIYLCLSNDFFINEMAMYFSLRYNIPIVTVIGDDYYYNSHFSFSPFYYLYRTLYKRMFRKLFSMNIGLLYNSEKLKDKYKEEFKNINDTIYISSNLDRQKNIKTGKKIVYAGNLELGRYKSLISFGKVANKFGFEIDVYSPQPKRKILSKMSKISCLKYCGSLNYSELISKIYDANYLLIMESFSKKDIPFTRYSLSTKVADYLATSIPIIAYGPYESGCIKYLTDNQCSVSCTDKTSLEKVLFNLSNKNVNLYKISEKENIVFETNHTKKRNNEIFYQFVRKLLESKHENKR